MRRSSGWLFASMALYASIATFSVAQRRTPNAAKASSGPFGRYSEVQILQRTRDLDRCYNTETSAARLSTEQQVTYSPDGPPVRHWIVNYRNDTGEYVGHVDWNADNGQILFISHVPPSYNHPAKNPMSQTQAAAIMRAWLKALNARDPEQWSLDHKLRKGENSWTGRWRAKGRAATVSINAEKGNLIVLRTNAVPVSAS